MAYDVNRDPLRDQDRGRVFPVHRKEGHSLHLWSRIEVVDFIGCIPYINIDYLGDEDGEVAFLPYTTYPQHRFRFDVRSFLDETNFTPEEFVEDLEVGSRWYGYRLMLEGSMVLVVHSEQEKTEVEAAVAQTTALREKFSVVLED